MVSIASHAILIFLNADWNPENGYHNFLRVFDLQFQHPCLEEVWVECLLEGG